MLSYPAHFAAVTGLILETCRQVEERITIMPWMATSPQRLHARGIGGFPCDAHDVEVARAARLLTIESKVKHCATPGSRHADN